MRLTPELISQAPAYINPLQQREINLRGFKISAIENLGVTNDEYEVIDLSDNDVQVLENFPLLKRLDTLIINNNRISIIDPNLSQNLPSINTLILTRNRLETLNSIKQLSQFKKLTHLSLLHNAVTKLSNYRLYVIHHLPQLKVLDFQKIKPKERETASRHFAKASQQAEDEEDNVTMEDTTTATSAPTSTTTPSSTESSTTETETATTTTSESKNVLSSEIKAKIMQMIRDATTITEMEELEHALKTGDISKLKL